MQVSNLKYFKLRSLIFTNFRLQKIITLSIIPTKVVFHMFLIKKSFNLLKNFIKIVYLIGTNFWMWYKYRMWRIISMDISFKLLNINPIKKQQILIE